MQYNRKDKYGSSDGDEVGVVLVKRSDWSRLVQIEAFSVTKRCLQAFCHRRFDKLQNYVAAQFDGNARSGHQKAPALTASGR